MLEFVHGIMDAGGNVPMLGDADDGYAVRLSNEPNFCPYRSLLATGAILFERPDFAVKSGRLDDKTRLLTGGRNWHELADRSEITATRKQQGFPDGGYYILGQDFDSKREISLLVDSGPLGYLSIAAHGHADALAVCLSVAGREFLVDPGTYTYHGKPDWRRYFKGTRAHNTVCVDGQDQSEWGGSFLWTRHAEARCTKFAIAPEGDMFDGEHDGYSRLADPLIHRRRIKRDGCRFDIRDTLECRGVHRVERCWHFSEACTVTISDQQVVVEKRRRKYRLDRRRSCHHDHNSVRV